MTVKKNIGNQIVGLLHLWLGLSSGLVVFVVAITGCIYAFQQEIQDLTQPYRFVEARDQPPLPPSRIRQIADAQLPGKHIHGVLYQEDHRAANAIYYSYEDDYYDFVYVNPYTGQVLKVQDVYQTFFRFILDGHFYLWLPHEIGQPAVATATLVFVVMLLTGLVLWFPKSRKGLKQRFSIKWNARWRRTNYDLHNVLGFYVLSLALVLALTGLVWGFAWFKEAVYAAAGGKKSLTYTEPLSDSTASVAQAAQPDPVDLLWEQTRTAYPQAASIEMHFPETAQSPIHVAVNPDAGTYWQIDYLYYDQYTLEEVPADHVWDRFAQASVADRLMRMNYDVHTGAIAGLTGKILAFLVSLIIASLPVTGTMIWLGRKRKKNKRSVQTSRQRSAAATPQPH